jgi:heat shock protein HslJ
MRESIFILLAGLWAAIYSTAAAGQSGIVDRGQWLLVELNGRAVTSTTAYFETEANRTRFTGDTGCNRMFGDLTVTNDRIAFKKIGTSRKACRPQAGQPRESDILAAMRAAVRYTLAGNDLTIFDRRGRRVLRFRRMVKMPPEPAPDAPPQGNATLETRKWMLEKIHSRPQLRQLSGAFISFGNRDNSAGGNSGCNVFGGEYSATRTTIAIRDIVSTMIACTEGDKMDVEREFLGGLRSADRYEIREGGLYLYRGGTLLLTFRGERKP